MVDLLGDRLPRFTPEEVELLKGSSEVRHPLYDLLRRAS